MKELLFKENVALELSQNSENSFLDPNLIGAIGTERSRPVAESQYLLVEAPYSAPLPALPEMVFQMKLKGITPLIAHPERCMEFQEIKRALAVVDAGAVLQLDVGSLTGRYGRTAKKIAKELLEHDGYGIAATDLHSPAGAKEWLTSSFESLREMVGPNAFDSLLGHNPRKILRGQPLE
jgi:protein-tyrosine phosphatase